MGRLEIFGSRPNKLLDISIGLFQLSLSVTKLAGEVVALETG